VKRLAAVVAAAVLVSVAGSASIGSAQDSSGSVIITDAATYDYPSAPDLQVVCVNGANPQPMEVGDQYFVEEFPGDLVITVFESDTADCSGVPDQTYTIPLAAGDQLGLVIGWGSMYTFAYDDACVDAGTARVLTASGLDIGSDVYLESESEGTMTPLALDLFAGTAPTANVTAGTYDVVVVSQGGDPWGPRLATIPGVSLSEGTSTQIFLAGGNDGETGGFTFQQGPEVCTDAEPPPSSTSTSTSTSTTTPTSTSTTTSVAAAGETANPATPVSGSAAYTG
jgi:hypothetical protein